MRKDFFNQASFMMRVDARRKELGFRNKEIAATVGLGGNAYSEWKSGVRRMNVDQVIAVCAKVKIRPAWAVFDEGPMTDEELVKIKELRDVIASLAADVQRVAAPPQYVPEPQLQLACVQARKELDRVLAHEEVNLPKDVYESLKRIQTALHQIDAPQVSICQEVLHGAKS